MRTHALPAKGDAQQEEDDVTGRVGHPQAEVKEELEHHDGGAAGGMQEWGGGGEEEGGEAEAA